MDHLQGGRGVAARSGDAGELFGDSEVGDLEGGPVLLWPVGDAVACRQRRGAISALKF